MRRELPLKGSSVGNLCLEGASESACLRNLSFSNSAFRQTLECWVLSRVVLPPGVPGAPNALDIAASSTVVHRRSAAERSLSQPTLILVGGDAKAISIGSLLADGSIVGQFFTQNDDVMLVAEPRFCGMQRPHVSAELAAAALDEP